MISRSRCVHRRIRGLRPLGEGQTTRSVQMFTVNTFHRHARAQLVTCASLAELGSMGSRRRHRRRACRDAYGGSPLRRHGRPAAPLRPPAAGRPAEPVAAYRAPPKPEFISMAQVATRVLAQLSPHGQQPWKWETKGAATFYRARSRILSPAGSAEHSSGTRSGHPCTR